MEQNLVFLTGTVKRDAEGVKTGTNSVLDFAVTVFNGSRYDIYDCRTTSASEAYQQLEGFVSEGEEISVVGHLEKMTSTDSSRIAGVMVEVKRTNTIVYVDQIQEA